MEQSIALLSFVIRVGNHFSLDGQPFYVNGWNSYWFMVNAADASTRSRVDDVLAAGASLGLTVCRTWAFNDGTWQALQVSPGNYDENVFQALDYVIYKAQSNGVRLLLSLVNNWQDFGGRAKYITWAQAAGENVTSEDDFYTNAVCRQFYKDHVKAILTRVNTFTQVEYLNDGTIFGWELINEPECSSDPSGNTLQAWIEEMATYVKSLDNNHLLTVGVEGFYASNSKGTSSSNPNSYSGTLGTDFVLNHQASGIDFATAHAYPDSWLSTQNVEDYQTFFQSWVDAHIEDAETILGMPVLFTEFGLSSTKPNYTTTDRDAFYKIVFDKIYASAQINGAGAGALLWQFLHTAMTSWDDGYGIYPFECSSITELIQEQSSRLQTSFEPSCCWPQDNNTSSPHRHSITKIFKGVFTHIFK